MGSILVKKLERIIAFALRKVKLISIISVCSGLVILFLLPILAKNVYVDENALLPGSATPTFDSRMATEGLSIASNMMFHFKNSTATAQNLQSWAFQYIQREMQFLTSTWQGRTVVSHVRSHRGFRDECILFVTTLPTPKNALHESTALSLGLSLALVRHLGTVKWLSRDILWLLPEDDSALTEWMEIYHRRAPFKRAGVIYAGLILRSSVPEYPQAEVNVQVAVHGNLDILAVVGQVSIREGVQLSMKGLDIVRSHWIFQKLGELVEWLGKTARILHLSSISKDSTTKELYLERLSVLANSFKIEILRHSNEHKLYSLSPQVDFLSLMLPNPSSQPHSAFYLVYRMSRTLEGTLRSLSNLLEKFHHSHFLYLSCSPTLFVPLPLLCVPLGLLLFPQLLFLLAHFSNDQNSNKKKS